MVYTYIMILFPNPPKPTLVSMCLVGEWERPVFDSLLNLRYCSELASVVFRRPSSVVHRQSSVVRKHLLLKNYWAILLLSPYEKGVALQYEET